MDLRKHYLMTFFALFSLGLILTKPSDAFKTVQETRECNFSKGKMDCAEIENQEYRLNYPVKYVYQ